MWFTEVLLVASGNHVTRNKDQAKHVQNELPLLLNFGYFLFFPPIVMKETGTFIKRLILHIGNIFLLLLISVIVVIQLIGVLKSFGAIYYVNAMLILIQYMYSFGSKWIIFFKGREIGNNLNDMLFLSRVNKYSTLQLLSKSKLLILLSWYVFPVLCSLILLGFMITEKPPLVFPIFFGYASSYLNPVFIEVLWLVHVQMMTALMNDLCDQLKTATDINGLKQLRSHHMNLCQINSRMDGICTIFTPMMILTKSVRTIQHICNVIKLRNQPTLRTMYRISLILDSFPKLLFTHWKGSQLEKAGKQLIVRKNWNMLKVIAGLILLIVKARSCLTPLHSIQLNDMTMLAEVEQFRQQIKTENVTMTSAGYFKINMSSFLAVSSLIATYIIVMLQSA